MYNQQEKRACLLLARFSHEHMQAIKLTSALVVCCNIEDTVGINFKGDLNLRYSPGCRGDACQVKLAQLVVVLGHGTLTLIHLQIDNQTLRDANT